ncbi:hypothetical protein BRC73_08595 [Halobacteriales archaeon QH_7_66_37]|nr:MAG: hypothetical protein BRC73_08595 [Halobacteriales archaeon QH_7_66_37]
MVRGDRLPLGGRALGDLPERDRTQADAPGARTAGDDARTTQPDRVGPDARPRGEDRAPARGRDRPAGHLPRVPDRHTLREGEALAVSDALAEGWADDPAYEQFGLGCYLGVPIHVGGEQYGTVCFADSEPRRSRFDRRDETFIELLADWLRHLLEQRAYERELEEQRAFTESLINSLPDLLYAFDESGEVVRWNDRLEAVTGYGPQEVEGMEALAFIAPEDREAVTEAISGVWDGEQASVEARIRTRDGEEIPYELSGSPLRDETGSVVAVAGVGRDVTERKAHRERLSNLLETTRSLMQARDREHVAELATAAARDLLGFDSSTVRLYDNDAKTLVPAAATGRSPAELPVTDVEDGPPGEVFASGESRLTATPTDADVAELGDVTAAMYYPMGVHGTIAVGVTDPDGFDDTDEQVLALLATSAAAACTRAKREREVREAREHTERTLDRVNGLLQNTVEELVQATTREELETGVVEELAAADPYAFAWIGQPDLASETLSPTASAGDAALPIHGHSFPLAQGGEPVSDAFRDGTPQIVEDVGDGDGPWGNIAGDADVEALLVVPLVYKDATYGVLAVFAESADAVDERERVVVEAIGRAVANAINAVERGRILDATEIIELAFAVGDPDLLFNRLSAGADCRIESAGIDYRSDGNVRLYLTATGVDAADLLDVATTNADVRDATLITEHEDECLLEVIVAESLFATLTEYGAAPRGATAENGTTEFTVELPYEAEARELFELVEDRYPGTELLGYHERERDRLPRGIFRLAPRHRRQRTRRGDGHLPAHLPPAPPRRAGEGVRGTVRVTGPAANRLSELFGRCQRVSAGHTDHVPRKRAQRIYPLPGNSAVWPTATSHTTGRTSRSDRRSRRSAGPSPSRTSSSTRCSPATGRSCTRTGSSPRTARSTAASPTAR